MLLYLVLAVFEPPPVCAETDALLWQSLGSGGHFAMLRHAIAPGFGDPEGFTLGVCATQRNLSAEGRRQAERVGQRFRQHGIDSLPIFTSQWCRCQETARLLGLGDPRELPVLNSFFAAYEKKELQTEQLREWLRQQDLSVPMLLVTHQVNITAFSGVHPGSGEVVVMRRTPGGGFVTVGTIDGE